MTKQEFLALLQSGLSGLPKADVEERINFYSEMIDDRIDDGLCEQEAVSEMGDPEEIISQIIADYPFSKLVMKKIKPKRKLTALEIVLIVLGAPLWIPLIIAFFAVIFSVYISLWAIIISLWAVFVSFIASAVGGILCGVGFCLTSTTLSGIALIGASLVLAGLSIFVFYGCKAATKGILWLTKKIFNSIKKCFITKEAAQ